MEKITRKTDLIASDAKRENIPTEKYKDILLERKKALYHKEELKKAFKYLLENSDDDECFDVSFDVIIDLITKITKHNIKSELLKENWRIA